MLSKFRNVFKNIAEKYTLEFMPFILEGVGGIPELNQADGIHPTIEGQTDYSIKYLDISRKK